LKLYPVSIFGKSRAKRQELVQWTNLVPSTREARWRLAYQLFCKVLTLSLFNGCNGTLIKQTDIGGKRKVCGVVVEKQIYLNTRMIL